MSPFLWTLFWTAAAFLAAWAYVALDDRRKDKEWEADVRRMERSCPVAWVLEEMEAQRCRENG